MAQPWPWSYLAFSRLSSATWKTGMLQNSSLPVHFLFPTQMLLGQIAAYGVKPTDTWFTRWQPPSPNCTSRSPWMENFHRPQRHQSWKINLKPEWELCFKGQWWWGRGVRDYFGIPRIISTALSVVWIGTALFLAVWPASLILWPPSGSVS